MAEALRFAYCFVALKTNTTLGRPCGWMKWQNGAADSSAPLVLRGAHYKGVGFVSFYKSR